ncbi:hypothetical protein FRC15_006465, partial [Serendipita sp. 397]
MASVVTSFLYPPASPSAPAHPPSNHTTPHPSPRSGGILLNPLTPISHRARHGQTLPDNNNPSSTSAPNSPYRRAQTLPLPRTGSDASSSNHGGESGSGSGGGGTASNPGHGTAASATAHSRTGSVRKIRFAPLPDPRREDELALMMATTDSPVTLTNANANGSLGLSTTEGVQQSQDTTTMTTMAKAMVMACAPNCSSETTTRVNEPVATSTNTSTSISTVSPNTTSLNEKLKPIPANGHVVVDGLPTSITGSDEGGAAYLTETDTSRPQTPTNLKGGGAGTPSKTKSSWSKRLFKPLLGGGGGGASSKLEGGRGAYSDDDGGGDKSGGFGSLFRTESRDSVQSSTSEGGGAFGFSMGRRRTSSAADSKPISSRFSATFSRTDSGGSGVPLARAQSLQAGGTNGGAGGGRRRTNQQQRMLNGRVYGARSAAMRKAFANVQDWEPEFVEWGHGGAGSVKNANAVLGGDAERYKALQSGGKVSIGADATRNGAASTTTTADDEDDGSGMAWVRRRREQREKERREKEEEEERKRAEEAA